MHKKNKNNAQQINNNKIDTYSTINRLAILKQQKITSFYTLIELGIKKNTRLNLTPKKIKRSGRLIVLYSYLLPTTEADIP